MKVAVIGAGISGLAAARALAAQGDEAVLFEASEKVGGRVETLKVDGFVFDTGATTIAPRGRTLEAVMLSELDSAGLVRIEKPIYVHSSLRVSPGDLAKNRVERYCYREGNAELANRLAEGLSVRLSSKVDQVEGRSGSFEVQQERFDGVILTMPTPECLPILEGLGMKRPFANSMFRPCLSVCLGYATVSPSVSYHALVEPENSHPLSWLSIESLKSPGRSADDQCAIVAQLGPQYSRHYFESEDRSIVEATADILVRLYGKAFDHPVVSFVRRWRYSQPETTAIFDSVNRPGSRVLVAGDGVMGGRVEYAYESGVLAAKMMRETNDA